MTKREVCMMLAGALIFSGIALWGAIYIVDNYFLNDDVSETVGIINARSPAISADASFVL